MRYRTQDSVRWRQRPSAFPEKAKEKVASRVYRVCPPIHERRARSVYKACLPLSVRRQRKRKRKELRTGQAEILHIMPRKLARLKWESRRLGRIKLRQAPGVYRVASKQETSEVVSFRRFQEGSLVEKTAQKAKKNEKKRDRKGQRVRGMGGAYKRRYCVPYPRLAETTRIDTSLVLRFQPGT